LPRWSFLCPIIYRVTRPRTVSVRWADGFDASNRLQVDGFKSGI